MVSQPTWQFHCPECGFGHIEHGHLLSAHEIYCMLCMEEDGREVRVHRWESDQLEEKAD